MHSQIQPLRNAMLTDTNNKKYKFYLSIIKIIIFFFINLNLQ